MVPMDGTVDVRVQALLKCDARMMGGTNGVRGTALVECRHGTVEVLRMLCDTLALLRCCSWHHCLHGKLDASQKDGILECTGWAV